MADDLKTAAAVATSETTEMSSHVLNYLDEKTALESTDQIPCGDNGSNQLVRFSITTLFNTIKNWVFNTLNTSDQTLPGAINELKSGLTDGSVSKIGTATVGGTVKPIYLNGGVPAAISGSAGGSYQPVYLNAGTITACSGRAYDTELLSDDSLVLNSSYCSDYNGAIRRIHNGSLSLISVRLTLTTTGSFDVNETYKLATVKDSNFIPGSMCALSVFANASTSSACAAFASINASGEINIRFSGAATGATLAVNGCYFAN